MPNKRDEPICKGSNFQSKNLNKPKKSLFEMTLK